MQAGGERCRLWRSRKNINDEEVDRRKRDGKLKEEGKERERGGKRKKRYEKKS